LIYLNRLQEAANLIKRLEGFFEEKRMGPVWLQIVQHAHLIQENNPAKIESVLTEVRETADVSFRLEYQTLMFCSFAGICLSLACVPLASSFLTLWRD